MRILITGGTGLIGQHLCKALLAEGHQLTVLSRHPSKTKGNVVNPIEIVKQYETDAVRFTWRVWHRPAQISRLTSRAPRATARLRTKSGTRRGSFS